MWIECGKMCIAVNRRLFHQNILISWLTLDIQKHVLSKKGHKTQNEIFANE